MDGFSDGAQSSLTLALRVLQPPLGHELLWLWEIPLLVANDHVLENHLHLKEFNKQLENNVLSRFYTVV